MPEGLDQVDQEQRRGGVFAQHRRRQRDRRPRLLRRSSGSHAAPARSSRCRCGPRRPTATRRAESIRTSRCEAALARWACRAECLSIRRSAPIHAPADQRLEQQPPREAFPCVTATTPTSRPTRSVGHRHRKMIERQARQVAVGEQRMEWIDAGGDHPAPGRRQPEIRVNSGKAKKHAAANAIDQRSSSLRDPASASSP